MENEFSITDDLYASKGKRFLNYLIDVVVIYVIILILFTVFAIIANLIGNESFLFWLQNMTEIHGYLVFFGVMITYYVFMESIFSSTIGKFLTQTKVVLIDGTKPSSQKIIKRTFCRLIPFDGLSFLGTYANGWHDSITGTFVVKKKLFQSRMELHNSFEEIGIIEE